MLFSEKHNIEDLAPENLVINEIWDKLPDVFIGYHLSGNQLPWDQLSGDKLPRAELTYSSVMLLKPKL